MDEDLYRLVYYSHNRVIGSREALAAQIADILARSRANNVRNGVTGALIFNSGIFAQVLEGARGAVEKTFETIQRDPRHDDVGVLFLDRTDARLFPSWSMAFIGRSRQDRNLFGHLARRTGFEERRLEGERIFQIMRQIAEEEERITA